MFLSLIIGCEEDSPANLKVSHLDFTETYSNEVLDIPNGTYIPDNPDFDINNPETWTGNMAEYVNHNYMYSVSFNIKNLGGIIAYDTEIDLYYTFDNGEEKVETIYIGDIKPNESISTSTGIGCTNKQLMECGYEVFWFD
jgi:hypothetical protein